jgi:hypothetical protein
MWQATALLFVASVALTLLQTLCVMAAWDKYLAHAIGAKPLGFWGALMVVIAIQSLRIRLGG